MVRLVDHPQGSLEEEGQGPGRILDLVPVEILGTCWCLTVPSGSSVLCPLLTLMPVPVLVPQRSPGISAGSLEKRPAWESRDLWSRWSFVTDCQLSLSEITTLPHPLLLPT